MLHMGTIFATRFREVGCGGSVQSECCPEAVCAHTCIGNALEMHVRARTGTSYTLHKRLNKALEL